MSWFLAILVRGVHTGDGYDSERMGDLLYKLVEATDAEGAYARALVLGETSRETMTTVGGETVTFEFLGLGDLMEITASKLEHGVEVYSEMIGRRPHERVREKDMLMAFAPPEIPDDADSEGMEEPSEPGSDRFRPGPVREGG